MTDTTLNEYTSDYWRIALPEGWELEGEEDDLAVFAGPDESELCLSCTVMDEDLVELEDLEAFAEDLINEGHTPEPASLGGMHGLHFSYDGEGRHWQEWYLASDNVFVYLTLNHRSDSPLDSDSLLSHFEVLD